jgi:hypothetical protein
MAVGMLVLASPLLELPTYPFNLLGLILLGTGFTGYCPVYGMFSSLRLDEDAKRRSSEPTHGSAA